MSTILERVPKAAQRIKMEENAAAQTTPCDTSPHADDMNSVSSVNSVEAQEGKFTHSLGHENSFTPQATATKTTKLRGWGHPPYGDLPLRATAPTLDEEDRRLIVEHIARQPKAIADWVLTRTKIYSLAKPWILTTCEAVSGIDLILWQRKKDGTENTYLELASWVIDELRHVEEANTFFRNKATSENL